MTGTPIFAQAEFRRYERPSTRAKIRSAAESHSGYEPGGSDGDAEYGTRHPCFN